MRSIIVNLVALFFCLISLLSILTIDSYVLQQDEIERAMDFTLQETMNDPVTDPNEIALKVVQTMQTQIQSNRGTCVVYVLYADDNIIDLAVSFSYTQYNGTKKEIEKRKTIIKDWEDGKENEAVVRRIGKEFLNKSPENGGLKENSVWKTNNLLKTVLEKEKTGMSWGNPQFKFEIKTEK